MNELREQDTWNDSQDVEMPEPRTEAEIAELKRQWLHDGCWDIEDTEGFEYHYMELRRWREAWEEDRRQKEERRVMVRGEQLGFTYTQMCYFETMERQIKQLREQLGAT